MKIELEEPFRSMWKFGYLRTGSEGRKLVDLYNSDTHRSTISYARYLMCVKIGYILSSEFEVDHKDNDKTNDDINNLQILTQEENRLKQEYNYIVNEQVVYGVYCAYCGTPFLLTEREVNMKIAKGVELPFCGRSCAGKYHTTVSKRSNQSK